MLERLSADATKAVFLAQEEARRLGHNYIDTEILMLGLIAVASATAAGLSEPLAASLKATSKAIESVIGRGSDFVTREPLLTDSVNRVIKNALQQAPRAKAVTSALIFQALLLETDCDAVQILESLAVDRHLLTASLKKLSRDKTTTTAASIEQLVQPVEQLDEFDDEHDLDEFELEERRAHSREQALTNVFGLNNFMQHDSIPPDMLNWFDEKDTVLGVYFNAEDDLFVVGQRGICWFDGLSKTYIEYRSIDAVEEPEDEDDPYLKLVLRPKGKVLMLPVLHSTEGVPDYIDVFEYLSYCSKPKVMKMDIRDIESKDDLVYFLRQPSIQTPGFEQLASWLQNGGPKPSWLGPLNIAEQVLNDPNVWRLFALMLMRLPDAADND